MKTTPSFHTFTTGAGGLQKVTLTSPDGAQAEIYPYGAHLTSWIPAGGSERLFLSAASEFLAGAPIRGGVPVIFPQFGLLGPLPMHGFARVNPWQFNGCQGGPHGSVNADFELGQTPAIQAIWPFPFRAWLEVSLGGLQLAISLRISNPGEAPFSFTAALHTYFRVTEIGPVRVGGLSGVHYLDRTAGGAEAVQVDPWVTFPGEVDRLYLHPTGPVTLHAPGRAPLKVSAAGFPDVVTWNPGSTKGATIRDLEPEGYQHLVCVEAAAAGSPVTLEPGKSWEGSQTLVEE
jgi:glucose-6-phosphate 1-epimerase